MLICPHCEKSLGVEHDDKACRRRMSRRFFFGLAVAPLAAAIAAKIPMTPGTSLTLSHTFTAALESGCNPISVIRWMPLAKGYGPIRTG
jgi:hypothetical protein